MILSLLGKQLTVFVANDKIRTFKQKLEFGKIRICPFKLEIFPVFRRLLNRLVMILRNLILNII